MAYTRPWLDTNPADADNISAGAGEIRNESTDIRERIDRIATDGTTPVPPATIADLDRRLATNVDPLWTRGDRVDLRGCTWRNPTSVTDSSSRVATTSWSPIGNPGGAVGTGSFFISITPVSAKSLLELRLQCFVHFNSNNPVTSDATKRGDFRIVQDPAGTPVILSPIASVGRGTTDVGSMHMINLVVLVTNISAATRFEPQFIIQNASSTVSEARGDITPSHFSIVEHV